MRASMTLTLVLVSTCALAGSRGALREAKEAVGEVEDLAEGSDAKCARALRKKANELADAVAAVRDEELSARRVLSRARELRDWAESQCPARLADKVGAQLDVVVDALRDAKDDDDDDRPRRRRDDDDDDDRPRAVPAKMNVRRDCGMGADDPGCSVYRGGQLPMDREAWQGFIGALRANPNEILKVDSVKSVVSNNVLTARQLGAILDCFRNEILRLDAAKAAAPRVVNPQHALGHASKFQNSILAGDYTRLFNGG